MDFGNDNTECNSLEVDILFLYYKVIPLTLSYAILSSLLLLFTPLIFLTNLKYRRNEMFEDLTTTI